MANPKDKSFGSATCLTTSSKTNKPRLIMQGTSPDKPLTPAQVTKMIDWLEEWYDWAENQ